MSSGLRDWAWVPHVLAVELKKAISYRAAFWIEFSAGVAAELAIAYFLWKAIFELRHAQTLEGYSFHGLVFYYLFASLSAKIVRGNDHGYLAQEIYDGTLTRYLLYPLPFLVYKYVTHFSNQLIAVIQLAVAMAALSLFMGLPPDQAITPTSVAAGVLTCLLAGYLNFTLSTCLELVAFWQDVIWNLMAMLRFITMLLGGAMIPLAFFPAWGRELLRMTPFPVLVSFPARTFLGQVSPSEWFRSAAVLGIWAAVFTCLATWIWHRGTKQYSGVGI